MSHQITAYEKVAKAIHYIEQNLKQQPSLDDIAASVHLSPYHFQRMFTAWAGVSPKKFMQFLSVEYAKNRLLNHRESLLDTAYETGLSGSSRLHDLFVNIEGMTPGEYKNGGKKLLINYQFSISIFGELIVASTAKGVCHLAFVDDRQSAIKQLRERFPNAQLCCVLDEMQRDAIAFFQGDWHSQSPAKIRLHLKGTDFQLKVWQALLTIGSADLSSYGQLAQSIGNPNASRAVGTAIANNPVAYLIPCHRVIQATGSFGGYRWGATRKSAIIGWEAANQ